TSQAITSSVVVGAGIARWNRVCFRQGEIDSLSRALGSASAEKGRPTRVRAAHQICRAPSVDSPPLTDIPKVDSDQARSRHMTVPAYRCFLPDLTGFTGRHCTRPDPQRLFWTPGSKM